MKSSVKQKIVLIAMVAALSVSLTGCMKPYDKPEFVTVEPSQTAFLVPLIGDTTSQDNFESEQLLNELKVATKEIQIPHRWVQTGRLTSDGEYKPSAKVIVVERKPVTREWTTDKESGTNNKNEGIQAKTQDDIKFTANVSCTAQIDEKNAAKFLYRYNNSTLAQIMDSEIKTRVTTKIVEESAKFAQQEIQSKSEIIMIAVKDEIIPYFEERGITITALGLTSDFMYDGAIQAAIDNRFKAEKEAEAQAIQNQKEIEQSKAEIEKAQAEAEAMKKRQETLQVQIEMKKLENEAAWIEKWDGKLPQVQGETTPIVNYSPNNDGNQGK